jgi:hypothetical protein
MCEQPHPLAVALRDQPVALVLDLMDPFRPVGTLAALVGMHGSNGELGIIASSRPRLKTKLREGKSRTPDRRVLNFLYAVRISARTSATVGDCEFGNARV